MEHVGTRFTIPHGSQGEFTLMDNTGHPGYRLLSNGQVLAITYTSDEVDRAFSTGTWVKVMTPTEGQRIRVLEFGYPRSSDVTPCFGTAGNFFIQSDGHVEWYAAVDGGPAEGDGDRWRSVARWEPVDITSSDTKEATETEAREYAELKAERDKLNRERIELLEYLAVVAEDPSEAGIEDKRMCESFDGAMIRHGYSREEVREAREKAAPEAEVVVSMSIVRSIPRSVINDGFSAVFDWLDDNGDITAHLIDTVENYN